MALRAALSRPASAAIVTLPFAPLVPPVIEVPLPMPLSVDAACVPLRVHYVAAEPAQLLPAPGTLAAIGFGAAAAVAVADDPRWLRLPLLPLGADAVVEVWQIDATVEHGRVGSLRYAAGGGWLFGAIELDEAAQGGLEQAAETAYRALAAFHASRAERHVLRVWNYFGAINRGAGDDERYKRFCAGRARGMSAGFAGGYPAATAIGVQGAPQRLQIYWLAAAIAGTRVENPRQTSAWRYPRHYGPSPPTFARGMRLPGGAGLAISGTAAIVGHASQSAGDLDAQLAETFANLGALLAAAGVDGGFDACSPLKVYLRDPAQATRVAALLDAHLPAAVPRLLLAGDVCRAELAVEIDGWRLMPGQQPMPG